MIFELYDYTLQEVKKQAALVTEISEEMGDKPIVTFSDHKIDTVAKSIAKVAGRLIDELVKEAMPTE